MLVGYENAKLIENLFRQKDAHPRFTHLEFIYLFISISSPLSREKTCRASLHLSWASQLTVLKSSLSCCWCAFREYFFLLIIKRNGETSFSQEFSRGRDEAKQNKKKAQKVFLYKTLHFHSLYSVYFCSSPLYFLWVASEISQSQWSLWYVHVVRIKASHHIEQRINLCISRSQKAKPKKNKKIRETKVKKKKNCKWKKRAKRAWNQCKRDSITSRERKTVLVLRTPK